MIRATMIAAAMAAGLASPAAAEGEPDCLPAARLFEVKAETGWRVEQFATGKYGRPVYLALGPDGEIEIIAMSFPGVACLVFGGLRATEEDPEALRPPRD